MVPCIIYRTCKTIISLNKLVHYYCKSNLLTMRILLLSKACSLYLLLSIGYLNSLLIKKINLVNPNPKLYKLAKLSWNRASDNTFIRGNMKSKTTLLQAMNDKSGMADNLLSRIRNIILSVLLSLPLMLVISLAPVKAAGARSSTKSSDSFQKQSQSTKQKSKQIKTTNKNNKENSKRNSKARIELVVTDTDHDNLGMQSDKSKQLTNFGILLVAISGIYVIIAPDGSAKSKKGTSFTKKKRSKQIIRNEEENDEEEVEEEEEEPFIQSRISSRKQILGESSAPTPSLLSSKLSGKYKDLLKLPPKDELFDEDTPIDDILNSAEEQIANTGLQASSIEIQQERKSSVAFEEEPIISIPIGRQKMNSKLRSSSSSSYTLNNPTEEDSNQQDVPPFASIVSAPESSKLSAGTASVVPAVKETDTSEVILDKVPATTKKQPGILGRLFQKPGGGRATDIKVALKNPSDLSHDYRKLVASCLTAYVPIGTLPEVEEGGMFSTSTNDAYSNNDDVRMNALVSEIESSGLTEQEAAESFAEVTNALLIQIVDQAIQAIDKSNKDQSLSTATESMDLLTDFIRGAGGLFGKTTPNAQIEPIQYNGKSNKGKLENMYYLYAKGSTDIKSMLGMLGGLVGTQTEDSANAVDEIDPAVKAADKADRLGKVQFLFNIKEGKRNSIEQRISREMMMDMTKELSSGEDGGDLGKMMEAISGKAGSGDSSFDDIMSQFAASGGDASSGPGQFAGDMPKLDDMSQEELAKMMKDAMSSVRESLREGTVTKQDVAEFEKLIGMDVKQMVSMFDSSGRMDKRQLQKLNPDLAEMMDVFKQLAAIKK